MADITAELDLEIAKFKTAIAQARTLTKGLARNAEADGRGLGSKFAVGLSGAMRTAGKAIATTLAAAVAGGIAAVTAGAAGLKNALDLGGQFSDVGAQIGSLAGDALVLATAFEANGMNVEKMTGSVNKMQKAIVEARDNGGALADAFARLKLDPAALAALPPIDAFRQIGAAIAAIENPTERAASAMRIFGRSGGDLLVLFGDGGGLAAASESLGRQAQLLNENAGKFDRASDILGLLYRKVTGFFVGLGSRIVDQLLPVLEMLNKIDWALVGELVGQSLSDAVRVFGAAWSAIVDSGGFSLVGTLLLAGFKTAGNWLLGHLLGVGAAVGEFFRQQLLNVFEVAKILVSRDFWSGLGNLLMGIFSSLIAYLAEKISAMLARLSQVRGFGGLSGIAETMQDVGREARTAAADAGGAARASGAAIGARLTGRGSAMIDGLGNAYATGQRAGEGIFDLERETRVMVGAMARFNGAMNQARAAAVGDAGGGGGPGVPDASAAAGVFASVGGVQGAVNLLTGGSFQKLMTDQQAQANSLLTDVRDTLQRIEGKKPAASAPPPPPRAVFAPV